jgi:hypothetical protein
MIDIELLLNVLIFIAFTTLVIWRYFHNKKLYEESSYYQLTKIPYWQIGRDLGHNGEYLIYKTLKKLELEGAKFLFNLYIPTYNNKTTEIDVVMLTTQGIFVFESKNYCGWIFGTESQRKWTQSLHIGYGDTEKKHFFNPIMQNEYHIKYLKQLLNINTIYYSIVVFSNDCKFKNIIRKSNSKTHLIYRKQLFQTITQIKSTTTEVLSISEIQDLYNKLYPYSQVDENTKIQHIINLSSKKT